MTDTLTGPSLPTVGVEADATKLELANAFAIVTVKTKLTFV